MHVPTMQSASTVHGSPMMAVPVPVVASPAVVDFLHTMSALPELTVQTVPG
jgi:hypothetical protein